MKKFFDPVTEEEYFIGKVYNFTATFSRKNGETYQKDIVTILTPELCDMCIKAGTIKSMEVPDKKVEAEKSESLNVPTDVAFYLDRVINDKDKFLDDNLIYILLLRQIAIYLDKKYPDHIENAKEIYAIDATNGKIVKLYKELIKSYKVFAAFRTVEDARIACRILRDYKRKIYGQQKNHRD